ncbi:DoxX family protein [Chitinophaga defluvii]|uniref:DoxX family protein n=1 Tax=Chitinophaga defluvii TaxID=3163343 RepID=A0ABV2T4X8_9BACT
MASIIDQNWFRKPGTSNTVAIVLLVLRIVAGAAFVFHGWQKIQQPASWVPPGGPVEIPGVFQFLAAVAEFLGGIAWVLGIVTPAASLGIACTMMVALYFHLIVFGDAFVNLAGGSSFELPMVYLSIALVLLVLGPGKFSMDYLIFGERDKTI